MSRAREADAKLAKDELWEFAEHLGLEVDSEPHLLWVAQEAAHSCVENRSDCLSAGLATYTWGALISAASAWMCRGLPKGWAEVRQESGGCFYTHQVLGLQQWEHPCVRASHVPPSLRGEIHGLALQADADCSDAFHFCAATIRTIRP